MTQYGGSAECCERCEKTVYFTERQIGPGSKIYHKRCFNCTSCNRSLNSSNLTDSKTVVYCKSCYGRLFGPKGYGHGGAMNADVSPAAERFGATEGGMPTAEVVDGATDAPNPSDKKPEFLLPDFSKYAGGSKCPTCEKTVYFAEQVCSD